MQVIDFQKPWDQKHFFVPLYGPPGPMPAGRVGAVVPAKPHAAYKYADDVPVTSVSAVMIRPRGQEVPERSLGDGLFSAVAQVSGRGAGTATSRPGIFETVNTLTVMVTPGNPTGTVSGFIDRVVPRSVSGGRPVRWQNYGWSGNRFWTKGLSGTFDVVFRGKTVQMAMGDLGANPVPFATRHPRIAEGEQTLTQQMANNPGMTITVFVTIAIVALTAFRAAGKAAGGS